MNNELVEHIYFEIEKLYRETFKDTDSFELINNRLHYVESTIQEANKEILDKLLNKYCPF